MLGLKGWFEEMKVDDRLCAAKGSACPILTSNILVLVETRLAERYSTSDLILLELSTLTVRPSVLLRESRYSIRCSTSRIVPRFFWSVQAMEKRL